jgi:arylsulfatase A-like enzyme/Flp pilus assembly protein TadD
VLRGLTIAALLAACGGSPTPDGSSASKDDRPNVLVFTLDTLRADALGAYGNSHGASPNIDAMAQIGTQFGRAYTVTPLTIPAHSSLFTSLWPPRHGVQDNGDFFLTDEAVTLPERLKKVGYATMASVGAEVTSHHWGFAQGFDAFFDDMGSARQGQGNRWRVERPATEVVADAEGWFKTAGDKGKPWFAWIHMFDVHHPYVPPEPYKSQFESRPYLGEVAWTDSQVQRVIDGLRERGQLDNTWVFILSDHGEGRGSHGEMMHGVLLYNATTRIPFIVVPPGGGIGERFFFPVSIVDVGPTVLSLVGAPAPDGLDGIDLSPWLRPGVTRPDPPDRPVFLESIYAYRHYGWAPQKALVTQDYKLIDSTTPEIYAGRDWHEKNDLAQTNPKALETTSARLDALTSGMVQTEGAAGRAELSADRIAQLAALGYVTTSVDVADLPTDGLPNPVDRLPILREVEGVRRAFQEGDLELARTKVDALLKKEPTLVDIRNLQAQIIARSGDTSGALAALRTLDEEHPSTQTKSMIGNLLLQMGEMRPAVELFSGVIDTDPYLTSAWRPYLHALFLSRQIPRLDREVQRAKALIPDDVVVRIMEGVVLVMRGEMESAEPILLNVLEEDPNHPFVNHSLGLIRRDQGRPADAEQFLLEEVRVFPPAVPARRTLVELFAEQRRYTEQLEQLAAISEVEAPNVLTLHSQGQALFNLKRYDEAHAAVMACVTERPNYPGCVMLQANTLKKMGRDDEAYTVYTRALELAKHPPPKPEPTGPRGLPAAATNPPR